MIQVTGILLDPMNKPSAQTVIRVEALNSISSLKGMTASVTTDADGVYDFPLVNGNHRIELLFNDEYAVTGDVTIDNTVTSPLTLEDLLNG